VTLLYDTQSGAPQDAPVTTAVDGGNIDGPVHDHAA